MILLSLFQILVSRAGRWWGSVLVLHQISPVMSCGLNFSVIWPFSLLLDMLHHCLVPDRPGVISPTLSLIVSGLMLPPPIQLAVGCPGETSLLHLPAQPEPARLTCLTSSTCFACVVCHGWLFDCLTSSDHLAHPALSACQVWSTSSGCMARASPTSPACSASPAHFSHPVNDMSWSCSLAQHSTSCSACCRSP